MRTINKHGVKNYLANKRIAMIQKARHRTQTRIQFINNDLVDKKVLSYNQEIPDEFYDPYTEENIYNQIYPVNAVASDKDLRRVLEHSVISRNPDTEQDAIRAVNKVSGHVTELEVERTLKNLDYVDNVLNNTNVDVAKYEALIEKLPHHVSRKDVLEKCITTDKSLPPTRREAFLERALERGENYKGRQYSYKELNQLSRDLERYKTHRLDYETALMENRQAERDGYEKINQSKTWIWSMLDNTRHEDMDGETIDLTEKFEVTNEQTGDIDYLLFPGDVSNDHNNCSNICNCDCSYTINKE